MTLQQLEYLIAIYENGSMLKASRACEVTQPTLSAMLQKLEKELNVSIFDRSVQPLRVTEIGKEIINQARVILRTAADLKDMVNESRNRVEGELNIGVIPTVAPYFVPEFVNHFCESHKNIELTVEEMKTEDVIKGLKNSVIDMAVLATPLNEDTILEIPLYYERFYAYVSPMQKEIFAKESLKAEDLPLEALWVLSEGHCLTKQIFNFCGEETKTKQVYSAGSISTLIKIVDKVGGCTVIPELDIQFLSEEQKANVRPIENPIAVREISLVVKEDFIREKLLNEVVNSVKQIIPSEMIDSHLQKFAVHL